MSEERQIPSLNMDYYEQRRNVVKLDDEDTNKWEIETETIIDKFCRSLLGEVEDADGNWVRDYNKERRMNERGMSVVKSELHRVSRILFLSEIGDDDVNLICKNMGVNLADMFSFNWREFEIKPETGNFKDLSDMVVDKVFFALKSAKGGGMRTHRERAKYPQIYNPQQQAGGIM